MRAAATIHLQVNAAQLAALDRYQEAFDVPTRTALLDEALGEFLSRRKGHAYPRRFAGTTGKDPKTPRRRVDDQPLEDDQRIAG